MGGETFQSAEAEDRVEEALGNRGQGNVGEIGTFGESEAEKAVGVFDGTFLPRGVGVGVVDGGTEDLLKWR